MNMRKWLSMISALMATAVLFFAPSAVEAAGFPNKPIRIIVPTGPGGSVDLHARAVGSVIHEYLGQPMIVQLKGGGGGRVGLSYVQQAKPDGYTLLFTLGSQLVLTPHARNLGFDPRTAFVPIFKLNHSDYMLVSPANKPWKNFDEFIREAKKNPEKVSYGSSGMFGPGHTMILKIMADKGIKLNHVPFKGGGPAMRAMLGGHVDTAGAMPATGGTLGRVRAGKLRVLAVAAQKRNPLFPDAPTFKEKGVDFAFPMWRGFVAPKGTPQDRIDIIASALGKVVKNKTFKGLLKRMGEKPNPLEAKALGVLINDEYTQFGNILKDILAKKK